MKTLLCCFAFLMLCLFSAMGQQKFDTFSNNFVSGYNQLKLPQLELSYVTGLEHIGTTAQIEQQDAFFKGIKAQLLKYKVDQLTPIAKNRLRVNNLRVQA